jgi:hypothetical protein
MGKRSPRKGPSLARSLTLVVLGFVLGSAATYLVLSKGSPESAAPSRDRPASIDHELLAPVREILLAQGVTLSPGYPPGLDGPPAKLARQLPEGVRPAELPAWWGRLPQGESLLRMGGHVARALEGSGGEVLAGWEEIPGGRVDRFSPQTTVSVPYRTLIPGDHPGASLWIGVGREGVPALLLCLQRDTAPRS